MLRFRCASHERASSKHARGGRALRQGGFVALLLLSLMLFSIILAPARVARAQTAYDAVTVKPIINEFVFNHTGEDIREFIEIYGQPNADYRAYTVLVVNGDPANNPGMVSHAYPLSVTNNEGFWTTQFLSQQISNGANTLLLVSNFTGSQGMDLDSNNDGVLDVSPWSEVVDDVAVTTSDPNARVYSTVRLNPGYDGNSYPVGGASRIPNAQNTGSVNDWLRNNFEGQGLGCPACTGIASTNEAVNTPGAVNQRGTGQVTPPGQQPVINEFVIDHVGPDTNQFIEIYGQANANYSGDYTLLVVDGGGFVYRTYPVGVADASGFWRTSFLNSEMRANATNTLMLVRDYIGSVNVDLDQNDDGTFDFTAWSQIVDAIAISANQAGDRTYANVVLYPGFGGGSSPVGGASRIPNGQNTNSPSDWLINDFEGQGLGCAQCTGTASNNEAINTPGYMNQRGSGPTVTPVTPTPPVIYPTVTPAVPTAIPPIPGNCVNLIRNFSFESNGEWTLGQDPVPPRYSGDQRYSGLRSLLLGNPPGSGSQNKVSYSSARQLVTLPPDATTAYLRWWSQDHSQEGASDSPNRFQDRQEAILLSPNLQTLQIVSRERRNTAAWQAKQTDLTGYIGQSFYVYFNTFNDGNGQRTWQYLDDVQLLACYPDGYTPAPPPVVPTMGPPVQPPYPVYPTAPIYPPPCTAPTPCLPPTYPTSTPDFVIVTPVVLLGTEAPAPVASSTAGDVTPISIPAGPSTAIPVQPTVAPPATATLWPTALPAATATPPAATTAISAEAEMAPRTPSGQERSETPSAVATSSPMLTPDQGLAPPSCVELVRNGGFETVGAAWVLVANEGEATYATEIVANGEQSMRIGLTSPSDNPYESFIEQTIDLPDAYGSIVLTYRYYPLSKAKEQEKATNNQIVDIYDSLTGQLVRRLMYTLRNEQKWLTGESDLTALAGQKIQLRFSVMDGGKNGTAMYVDDVSILACKPQPSRGGGGDFAIATPTEPAANLKWFFDNNQAPGASPSGEAPGGNPFSRLGVLAVMFSILVIIGLVIWWIARAFRRP